MATAYDLGARVRNGLGIGTPSATPSVLDIDASPFNTSAIGETGGVTDFARGVSGASAGAGRGFVNPPAASAPPPQPATSTPAAAPASSPDIPDRWAQVRGYGATPSPAPAAAQPQNQVMPGVYSHGRGQYSDSPDGMGFKPGFTGQPNAQNLAAADGLAARALAQPSTPAPAAGGMGLAQAAGVSTPEAGFSGVIGSPINNGLMGSRTPEQQRRDAEVSASSIMNDGGRWDQHKGMSPARQALMAMDAQALEGIRGQNSMAQEAMRQAGGLQREGLQQAGANQRSMAQAALEQQKINQSGVQQGYANRAAGQQEQLRATLLDPNATPQQRQSAQQALLAIQGKQSADPYLVVPGGQHVDANSGKAYNTPSTVFNRNTGQFIQQPQTSSIPAGALELLRKDPSQAAAFDAKYGVGSAKQVLGQG